MRDHRRQQNHERVDELVVLHQISRERRVVEGAVGELFYKWVRRDARPVAAGLAPQPLSGGLRCCRDAWQEQRYDGVSVHGDIAESV